MRFLLLLTFVFGLICSATTVDCPGTALIDCFPCNKRALTDWFDCCSTPQTGYCCQYSCRQVECYIGGLTCPIFGEDDIERIIEGTHGPSSSCNGNGVCVD